MRVQSTGPYRSDTLLQKVPEPKWVRLPNGNVRGEVNYQRNISGRAGIQMQMNSLLATFNAQDDLKAWMETPTENLLFHPLQSDDSGA